MNKKVCIIYTGGTVGMTKTEFGYAPKRGYLTQMLKKDNEFNRVCEWDIEEFDPLLDSSNIGVTQWNEIGRVVYEKYNDYSGFVVIHGTDTMAYTASALSFMLEGLDKPVIITGSQIPFCEVRSDARDNLLTALILARDAVVKEVCLYFNGKLMRGNRSTKISSDSLTAFGSPNFKDLANVGIDINYEAVEDVRKHEELNLVTLKNNIPIAVIKIFPGISFKLFENILTEELKGIVLEAFGSGNVPGYDDGLIPLIQKAVNNDTIIAVCTQCIKGSVSLGTYATSNALKKAGAVSCYDMTAEAAVTKLYYLFSKGLSTEEIKAEMETDLRGELTLK